MEVRSWFGGPSEFGFEKIQGNEEGWERIPGEALVQEAPSPVAFAFHILLKHSSFEFGPFDRKGLISIGFVEVPLTAKERREGYAHKLNFFVKK